MMQNVNYIKHLNVIFEQFYNDNRLNPTHISLYIALFQVWNSTRFPDDFFVIRDEVMQQSKIGSKSTYHRCLKELDTYGYIEYSPSHNPYKGSKIKMFNFETSYGQAQVHNNTNLRTSNEQALVSNNKHIQTNRNNKNAAKLIQPKDEKEVIDFFNKENWSELEAQKFFNHYQGIGWKVGGKTKIVNWQSIAKNWILKAQEIKSKETQKTVSQNTDNLKSSKIKNYNEPL